MERACCGGASPAARTRDPSESVAIPLSAHQRENDSGYNIDCHTKTNQSDCTSVYWSGCAWGGSWPDTDGDGIRDDVDQCRSASETVNGFQDGDGCPDTPPILPHDFLKGGDNGTVSCATYCRGPEFGEVGTCVGAVRSDILQRVDCSFTPGNLRGRELTCECVRPVAPESVDFVKHGNNGTVSCKEYCLGPQWGARGLCQGGVRADNGQRVYCDTVPGFMNGAELSCECQSVAVHGNNGTVSCGEFCRREGKKGCLGAVRADNQQRLTCADVPGLLPDAKELTCECQ